MRRREFFLVSAGLALGGVGGALGDRLLAHPDGPTSPPPNARAIISHRSSAQEALQKLIDGNKRFVEGKMLHPHETLKWRKAIAGEQHPFAAVLGCSDSRVSPELLFDEGLGDLFVIRQAGNVADDDVLGSLEYAVEHLHVPLVVVLGHQRCGAVTAAVDAVAENKPVEGHVLRLVDDIAPAVWEVSEQSGDRVELAIRANIRQVVQKLRKCGPILRSHVDRGDVKIVGAYYDLQTGRVEWLSI